MERPPFHSQIQIPESHKPYHSIIDSQNLIFSNEPHGKHRLDFDPTIPNNDIFHQNPIIHNEKSNEFTRIHSIAAIFSPKWSTVHQKPEYYLGSSHSTIPFWTLFNHSLSDLASFKILTEETKNEELISDSDTLKLSLAPESATINNVDDSLSENESIETKIMHPAENRAPWTIEEKQFLMDMTQVLIRDCNFTVLGLSRLFVKKFPHRTLFAARQYARKMLRRGVINVPHHYRQYNSLNCSRWTLEETKLLKEIMDSNPELSRNELMDMFLTQNKGPKRHPRTVIRHLSELKRLD